MNPPRSDASEPRPLPAIVAGSVPLLLAVVLALFFVNVFRPSAAGPATEDIRSIDFSSVQAAMQPAAVAVKLEEILALGDRFMGRPGMRAAEAMVKATYEAAGLEILEHTVETVAPVTESREIQDAAGTPLAGVEVYPFLPNHLQPMTTGSEGMEGQLLVITPEVLRTRKDFTGVIGLIDATDGLYDATLGFDWTRYARLGIKALILAHPEGLERLPWDAITARGGMVSSTPVNYVRLAATPEIFQYVGQTIRLRVVTRWEPVVNTTFYGVLRGGAGGNEAIVVPASYDAPSILPDLSPGGPSALALAAHLQLVRALAEERGKLKRDIVFVCSGSSSMAEDGLNHLARILQKNTVRTDENPLLRALGIPTPKTENIRVSHLTDLRERNAREAEVLERIGTALREGGLLGDAAGTREALRSMGETERRVTGEQFTFVLNETLIELGEPVIEKRLAYFTSGDLSVAGEPFRAFLNVKRIYDGLATYSSYSPEAFLKSAPELFERHGIRSKFVARIRQLQEFHQRRDRELEQEIAIARAFNRYNLVSVFGFMPVAGDPGSPEQVTWLNTTEPGSASNLSVHGLLRAVPVQGTRPLVVEPSVGQRLLESHIGESPAAGRVLLDKWGYTTFWLVNLNRQAAYRQYTLPVVEPGVRSVQGVEGTLGLYGGSLLALGQGVERLRSTKVQEWIYYSFGGQVLVGGVGQSLVPTHPLPGAMVANRALEGYESYSRAGHYIHPIIQTDPYGRYLLEFNANDFPVFHRWYVTQRYEPVAASYDSEGRIRFVKDEGPEGQKLFKSTGLAITNKASRENTTIVTFRAAPMAMLDLNNPQTLRDYSGVSSVTTEGLTPPRRSIEFSGLGLKMNFLEPDEFVYVLLKSASPDNELIQTIRAFMLGIENPAEFKSERDIAGPGYLAASHPATGDVPLQSARSMTWLNGHRLALQERFNMADQQTLDYHKKSVAALDAAGDTALPLVESVALQRESVTYATINHPVIRRTIVEAVISIVWYLGLLVPFVFFFEKLVFGYADVRKQLAAQAVIFLVVFALLRLLHPAFEMVRSSVMILLGFFIILISGGITLLFSGKFKENLEEIRKQQGKVDAAEVNKFGVLGSAFMLGLNNMHRRKVRTGLTCATLTLLTFVMISFTSTQSSIVQEDRPIGPAAYQGMLIKYEDFEAVSSQELFALRQQYGDKYLVAPRRFYTGTFDQQIGQGFNPEFRLTTGERTALANSLLQLSKDEPLRDRLDFVTEPVWFTQDDALSADGVEPVILPAALADELGIFPEAVAAGTAEIRINGRRCRVIGIITTESLANLRDLDGVDLLPFDVTKLPGVSESRQSRSMMVPGDSERIDASRIVITPFNDAFGTVARGNIIIGSLAIAMPEVPYREAIGAISLFMERTGEPLYYGLDGIGYLGRRARETSLTGLIDLIIPLVLAGLTVLNTMKGSVYERRDEIYVYNAVGIAPRYIFFMFIAEALVYAVVGCVLGYLLSQGVGRVLTELGWTGGLNMTYASLSTIYASLTIMLAVIVSTWFPARSAMEIAKPADDAGWKMPEPEGDTLAFDLPFNFDTRQRMAVLSFFDRYLLDHSEGGAGQFSAGRPRMVVDAMGGERVPGIACTIWLKPFDLAVSQEVRILVPTDPDTDQFKARIVITRSTGTLEAWVRLNRTFVALVRRHFLHWRAVTDADRQEMFEEARQRFLDDLKKAELAGVQPAT